MAQFYSMVISFNSNAYLFNSAITFQKTLNRRKKEYGQTEMGAQLGWVVGLVTFSLSESLNFAHLTVTQLVLDVIGDPLLPQRD